MMKRLHVHVAVEDLARSIRFYSTLFAAPPTVEKPDYAKWMLDDPRVNFAISARGRRPGIDHLGIQVETQAELHETGARLCAATAPVLVEGEVTCCYARSEKSWVTDPQGVVWENFMTMAEATVYGESFAAEPVARPACCTPVV
jgi:catechol 2,3-dioxygenase-like lactoylglutathione lyase family enzyme